MTVTFTPVPSVKKASRAGAPTDRSVSQRSLEEVSANVAYQS